MNNPSAPNAKVISKPNANLLDTIRAIRMSVGNGLNDDELTRLLRQVTLLTEAGFGFLSISGGVVTLSVPQQDLASWHPEKGWIAPRRRELPERLRKNTGFRSANHRTNRRISDIRFPMRRRHTTTWHSPTAGKQLLSPIRITSKCGCSERGRTADMFRMPKNRFH